ncbi:YrrS family protein, partial [Bacillus thuringiensis]
FFHLKHLLYRIIYLYTVFQFYCTTSDWSEMKKAISYAVDVPESQLIFDFIGNNGNNKAYGNVRDKQSNKKYKVNIDWVENQGWKPVSVQVVK